MAKINRRDFVSASTTVLGAAGLRLPLWAQVAASGAASASVPLLLGVDYYPDQSPESLWEEDALMCASQNLRGC